MAFRRLHGSHKILFFKSFLDKSQSSYIPCLALPSTPQIVAFPKPYLLSFFGLSGRARWLSGTSAPVWEEEAEIIDENGAVIATYKGVRLMRCENELVNDSEIIAFVLRAIKGGGGKFSEDVVRELDSLNGVLNNYHATEALIQLRDADLSLRFFHWCGSQKWYKTSGVMFSVLMRRLGLKRHFEGLGWVLNIMQRESCILSGGDLDFLIECYTQNARFNEVISVFQRFLEVVAAGRSPPPSTPMCNRILESIIVDGKLYLKAAELYGEMERMGIIKPDKWTFELIIPCFLKVGDADGACCLLDSMKEKGLLPALALYAGVIEALGKLPGGRANSAFRLYKELQRSGAKLMPPTTYIGVIEALVGEGRLELGLQVWKEMLRAGVRPNSTVYASVIEAHLREGQFGKAMEFLNQMLAFGLLPTKGLYSNLIHAGLKAGYVETARTLFYSMQKAGALPSPSVCTALIKAHSSPRDARIALDLVNSMKTLGFVYEQ